MTIKTVTESLLEVRDKAHLSGVISHPPSFDPADPVVVIINSGLTRRIGTRRLSVKLNRRLARQGMMAVRFDLAGMGDSGVKATQQDFLGSACEDLGAVINQLTQQFGTSEYIVGGLCSGADVGLEFADRTENTTVRGVIQLNPSIHKNVKYYLHQCYRPAWWKSVWDARFGKEDTRGSLDAGHEWGPPPLHRDRAALLARVAEKHTALLALFTAGTISYPQQFQQVYASAKFGPRLTCTMRMTGDHVISAANDQDFVAQHVSEWCLALR